jgi:hypothetical protein
MSIPAAREKFNDASAMMSTVSKRMSQIIRQHAKHVRSGPLSLRERVRVRGRGSTKC